MNNQFEFDFNTIEKPKTFEDIINERIMAGAKVGYTEIHGLFQEYLKIFPADNKQETNVRYEEFKETLRGINSKANLGIDEKPISNDEGYLRLTRQFSDVAEDEEIFSDFSETEPATELPTKAPEPSAAARTEKSERYDKVKTHISETEKALNKKENDQD